MLLERKAMTNLENIIKRKDIIFLTKVRIVKATVPPVVMYRYDSWIIKKSSAEELMLSNCGAEEDS